MSKIGIEAILLVLLARLTLKKAPARLKVLLWWIVILRLLVPFSIPSSLSLLNLLPNPDNRPPSLPETLSLSEQVPTQMPTIDPSAAGTQPPPPMDAAVSASPQWFTALALLWLVGLLIFIGIGLYQYLHLRRRLQHAQPLGNGIYESTAVHEPFLFGLLRPRIYLPASLPDGARPYIIAHERAHRRCGDHLFSAFAYLALCIHWFNPFVWLSLTFFSDDVERACDESAVRHFTFREKQLYSHLILDFACRRNVFRPVELAFGGSSTAARIQGVLHNGRRPLWVTVLCIGLVTLLAASTITDPLRRLPVPLTPPITERLFQEERGKDNLSRACLDALSESSGIHYTESNREDDAIALYGHFPRKSDPLQKQALTLGDALIIAGLLKTASGVAFYDVDTKTPISRFSWKELSSYCNYDIPSTCSTREGHQRHVEKAIHLSANAVRLANGHTDYPQTPKEAQFICRFAPARTIVGPPAELFQQKETTGSIALISDVFAMRFSTTPTPTIQCQVIDLILDERSGNERQLIGIVHNISWQLHGNTLVMARSYVYPFAFEAHFRNGRWHTYNQKFAESGDRFIASVNNLCKDPKTGKSRPKISEKLIFNRIDHTRQALISAQLDRQLYIALEKAHALPVVVYGPDRLSLLSAAQKG